MSRHAVSAKLTAPERALPVVLAGCGGTGSQLLSGLARLHVALRALGHPGLAVTVYDPDTVTHANVGRQLYSPADVGWPKAVIAVTRVNQFFGLAWRAEPHRFPPASLPERPALVCSAVDSPQARLEIDRTCRKLRALYWLDTGNTRTSGQVILGTPNPGIPQRGQTTEARLPTVTECYPELARATDADPGPSCSLAAALDEQDLFVNQDVATAACALLWQAFRTGVLTIHGAFVDSHGLARRALPVDRAIWARLGVAWARRASRHRHRSRPTSRRHS